MMLEWSVSGKSGMERNQVGIVRWLGRSALCLSLAFLFAENAYADTPLYPGYVLPSPHVSDPFDGLGEANRQNKPQGSEANPANDNIEDPSAQSLAEKKRILDAAKEALQIRMRDLHTSAAALAKDRPPKDMIDKEASARLVGIYEAMPPRQAAAIFDVMDTHILVGIASQMNTRKLSAVMANMSPDRVNLISQFLVGVRSFPSHNLTLNELPAQQQGQMQPIGPLMPSRQ